jgi:hypothetical protein
VAQSVFGNEGLLGVASHSFLSGTFALSAADMKLTAVEAFPFQLDDKHGFRYVFLPFYSKSTQQKSDA